ALPVDDKRGKAASQKRVMVQDLLWVADAPKETPKPKSHAVQDFLQLLFGGTTRFVVGGLLLLAALAWMYSRDAKGEGDIETTAYWTTWWDKLRKAQPLEVPGVPAVAAKAVFSVGAFAAGVLMLVSTLWGSWKIGLFQMLAAVVLVIGPVSGLVPEEGVAGLDPLLACLAAGGALSLLGFLFGRDT
ncbi:MAG: hypothetical protein K2W96_06565, partial [Gemmataceae bacterium]|nr:hypothetical protein [Gemmataceae bacterium]